MTDRQSKAFELYYSMGSERSFEKLSKEMGVSKTTLSKWSVANGWQEMINQRDKSDADLLREEVLKAKRLALKAISAGCEQMLKDIENGTQKVSAKDFTTWINVLGSYDIAAGVGTQQAASNTENEKDINFTFNIVKEV